MTVAQSQFYKGRAVALFFGQTVSYLGSKITLVALPWVILERTGSPAQAGLVLLFQAIPFATVGFVIGPFLDRVTPRRLMVGADIARSGLIGAIALMVFSPFFSIPLLCVLAFFIGCGNIVSSTAREAGVPDLVPSGAPHELVRLNASLQFARNGAGTLGPLFGGVLLAAIGGVWCLVIDAVTYIASALATAWAFQGLRVEEKYSSDSSSVSFAAYWKDVRQGLRFTWREPVVRLIVWQGACTNFLLTPLLGLVLIVLVQDIWHDPTYLGAMLASFGVGSILCSVLLGMRPQLLPPFRFYGFVLLGVVLPLWTLLLENFLLMLVGLFFSGLFVMAINVAGDTALQVVTPLELRGRAFAVVVSGLALMDPLGLGMVGFVVDAYGGRVTIAFSVFLLTVVALVVIPVALRLNMKPGVAVASQTP